MCIYIKKLLRAPGFTLFWIVLLAISVAFSAVGFSAWLDVQNQIKQLNEKYVTAALRPEAPIRVELGEDRQYYSPLDLSEAALASEYVVDTDYRLMLAAHVPGTTALASGSIDELTYNRGYSAGSYNMSVIAVECLDVYEMMHFDTLLNEVLCYDATFKVLDNVCVLDAYQAEIGELVHQFNHLHLEDGTIPFKVGHTYLMFGYFDDHPIIQDFRVVTDDNGRSRFEYFLTKSDGTRIMQTMDILSDRFITLEYVPIKTEDLDALRHQARAEREDGSVYIYPTQDAPPTYAEYTGDWRDFFNSEEGTYWRETLLPMCEVNQSSATIIASDNLMSMYGFNTGEYSLLSGRMFTEDEYNAGDQVCVISAAYAHYNNFSLGDTIELDLYDTKYCAVEIDDTPSIHSSNFRPTVARGRCTPQNRMGVTLNCEIVGIYTGPTFSAGAHKFQADTIFIPKAAIPDAEKYEDVGGPSLLNSLILKNGSKDLFEEYMTEQGFPGAYIYVDQGFEESDVSFIAMEQNANRLALISAAAFLLVTFVCEMLIFRRFRPVVRSMRLLGISTKAVLKELMIALVVLTLAAIAVGTGLSVALYGTVTGQIISENLSLNFASVAMCAGAQLVLLLIVALVRSMLAANVRLMSSRKK